jgi:hypothetical protein
MKMADRRQQKILAQFEKDELQIQKEMEKLENIYSSDVRKLRSKVHKAASKLQDGLDFIDINREAFIERSTKINEMFYDILGRGVPIHKPVRIFSQPPMTEVTWDDGTKTRVVAAEGEVYDLEKGIAMAILKKSVYVTQKNYHLLSEYFEEILVGEKPVEVEVEEIDLQSMTVAELEEFATNRYNMPIPNGIRKGDLINLIKYVMTK